MRKQTKLVAVLSTAALLALGASMSSFAATGWQEENGTWVYYDKSGDTVTEKWEKSGDNWFYLNEDGEMATDVVVEYNDNYYYVDENGAMAANKWVSVENEDYGDDDDQPTNHWYYFGANGKAFKASTNSSNASFKIINGKKYAFDDEGKMLYGWIGTDGERKTGDDAWQQGVYYCGDENDGAQAVGWAHLEIIDDAYAYDQTSEGASSYNVFDDENQTRWFYFKTNGKKTTKEKGTTINGKKYSFDADGRMNAEWVIFEASPTKATATSATAGKDGGQGATGYTESWRYYGSPEDGARVTKGWFKVVPDSYLNTGDYEDDEDAWYYSDKDGKLVASKIQTINGKKYLFDHKGIMKSGLKFIKVEGKTVIDIASDDKEDRYDTGSDFKDNAKAWIEKDYAAYYFGSGDDGAMKTGKQTVGIDGENFTFLFNKSGGSQGAGKTAIDSNKFYLAGMLLTADKDDKYAVVKKETSDSGKVSYKVMTSDEFIKEDVVKNKVTTVNNKEYDAYYPVEDTNSEYKLINTAGTIQKNKDKAKDGLDYCFKLKGDKIEAVYLEK
ncbi:cell wall-binding protein [Lacrimispora sp. BS-2]|uniref:Cell wall-binding protein n=1 Tax=Lacrimispora sp. BS-2 TaxID=3151850 RepID=A0AAU7PNH7_9FIRM